MRSSTAVDVDRAPAPRRVAGSRSCSAPRSSPRSRTSTRATSPPTSPPARATATCCSGCSSSPTPWPCWSSTSPRSSGSSPAQSLPGLLGQRLRRGPRLAFWAQAELVAAATDIAEVVGGAIALNLLFGAAAAARRADRRRRLAAPAAHPEPVRAVAVRARDRRPARRHLGRVPGRPVRRPARRARRPVRPGPAVRRRRLRAARRLDARRDRHAARDLRALGPRPRPPRRARRRRRRACCGPPAGTSASRSRSRASSTSACCCSPRPACAASPGTDSIPGAYDAIVAALGVGIGIAFAVGLLASGLASTSVGAYAGATIMEGLLHRRVPLLVRRAVTLIPALAAARPRRRPHLDPGGVAGGPLVRHPVRGDPPGPPDPLRARSWARYRNGPRLHATLLLVVALVVALNLTLILLLALT